MENKHSHVLGILSLDEELPPLPWKNYDYPIVVERVPGSSAEKVLAGEETLLSSYSFRF